MSKKWIVVDVESNGPCPGLYSMVSFGAVVLDRELNKTFYGKCRILDPSLYDTLIPDPQAYKVIGVTMEEHRKYPDPLITMLDFRAWLKLVAPDGPIFISDNPSFDFQWINYYFYQYVGKNPFGWSGRRIGDIWAGLTKSVTKPWKHLRDTRHTHHPVDDARGNAEALLKMVDQYGLKIPGL